MIYIEKTRTILQVIFYLRPRWTQHPLPRWTRFGKNQQLILKTHFARLLQEISRPILCLLKPFHKSQVNKIIKRNDNRLACLTFDNN